MLCCVCMYIRTQPKGGRRVYLRMDAWWCAYEVSPDQSTLLRWPAAPARSFPPAPSRCSPASVRVRHICVSRRKKPGSQYHTSKISIESNQHPHTHSTDIKACLSNTRMTRIYLVVRRHQHLHLLPPCHRLQRHRNVAVVAGVRLLDRVVDRGRVPSLLCPFPLRDHVRPADLWWVCMYDVCMEIATRKPLW